MKVRVDNVTLLASVPHFGIMESKKKLENVNFNTKSGYSLLLILKYVVKTARESMKDVHILLKTTKQIISPPSHL